MSSCQASVRPTRTANCAGVSLSRSLSSRTLTPLSWGIPVSAPRSAASRVQASAERRVGLRRWSGKLAAELPLLWLGAVADLAPPRECRCADAVVAATVGLSHLLVGGGPRRVGHGRFPTSVTRPSRLPAGAPKRPKRGSAVPVGGCFPTFAGERGVPAPEAAGSRAWIPCRRRYSI